MMNRNEKKEIAKRETRKDLNGFKYIPFKSAALDDTFHVQYGTNKKLGPTCLSVNTPIPYSCKAGCQCKETGLCYCKGGTYEWVDSLVVQSENMRYFMEHGPEETVKAIADEIRRHPNATAMRWQGAGDIINMKYFRDVVLVIARTFPELEMWLYTKKTQLVNLHFMRYGIETKPQNLTIIFSLWTNENGVVIEVKNPFNFPTAVFIPVKHQELKNRCTFICDCAKPWKMGTCDTCEKPCRKMGFGDCVGFVEHSTKNSRKRDKLLKERRNQCVALGIDSREKYIEHFSHDEFTEE